MHLCFYLLIGEISTTTRHRYPIASEREKTAIIDSRPREGKGAVDQTRNDREKTDRIRSKLKLIKLESVFYRY